MLSKEKIKHSKSPKFCPICEQYDAGNRSTEVIRHKDLIPIQREQYLLGKKKIGSGETPKTALVTQDFTQIQFEDFVKISLSVFTLMTKVGKWTRQSLQTLYWKDRHKE